MGSRVHLSATVKGQDGPVVSLEVGARIGRSPLAELHLAHPAISEFHAYVVSRDEGMVLMASTHSPFLVDGNRLPRVVLQPGQHIGLAVEVSVQVHQVHIGPQAPLPRTTLTGRIPSRLTIRVRSASSVVIEATGQSPTPVDGVLANMLVAMLQRPRPTHWSVLARGLWPQHATDSVALERNWYRNLGRLRKLLSQSELRPDVVRSSGGQVEVFLWPNDQVIGLDTGRVADAL